MRMKNNGFAALRPLVRKAAEPLFQGPRQRGSGNRLCGFYRFPKGGSGEKNRKAEFTAFTRPSAFGRKAVEGRRARMRKEPKDG